MVSLHFILGKVGICCIFANAEYRTKPNFLSIYVCFAISSVSLQKVDQRNATMPL
ncbi:hypothetical protein RUA4292_03950 [Ruegeria atlantica]|uniref:Uncharacterized protein n=1 Tax=Ruegeria atlantica TaxID=81569 RepID=A0A0P1F259_9RHOB|nr:hypothetical protein RUA4292_03950 [Ruegeria atlantica]